MTTVPPVLESDNKRNKKTNAATAVSAAGARALGSQAIAFYFRAPVKAFFRTRVEYVWYRSCMASSAHTVQLSCGRPLNLSSLV